MNHEPVMAVINGVVARFVASGLPDGMDAEDLAHECYMKTVALWTGDESAALVAWKADGCILNAIKKQRRAERNIEKFTSDYLSGLSSKLYHAKKRIIDPIRILPFKQLAERHENWQARRGTYAGEMEDRTRKVRERLEDIPAGGGYLAVIA